MSAALDVELEVLRLLQQGEGVQEPLGAVERNAIDAPEHFVVVLAHTAEA